MDQGEHEARAPSAAHNVRHSEKRRSATCGFADAVSGTVIEKFREVCPADLRSAYRQTVLAGFVVVTKGSQNDKKETEVEVRPTDHSCGPTVGSPCVDVEPSGGVPPEGGQKRPREEGEDCGDKARISVVSVGVGTKFLTMGMSNDGVSSNHRVDEVVRDMHAEVLARRGLILYLREQLRIAAAAAAGGGGGRDTATAVSSIFEKVNSDDSTEQATVPPAAALFRLRSGVTLHFYSSSQPCGNASVKRFGAGRSSRAKPLKEGDAPATNTQDGATQGWNTADVRHPPLHVVARSSGQVALLQKHEHCIVQSENRQRCLKGGGSVENINLAAISAKAAINGPRAAASWCPYSCSDKIALWNVVGVQGKHLSKFLPEPIYLSSIVIGRKFSFVHSCRALCCRLDLTRQELSKKERRIADRIAVEGQVGGGSQLQPTSSTGRQVGGGSQLQPTSSTGRQVGGGSQLQPTSSTGRQVGGGSQLQPTSSTGRQVGGGSQLQPTSSTGRQVGGGSQLQPTSSTGHSISQGYLRVNHPALLCTSVSFDSSVRAEDDEASFSCPYCFWWASVPRSGGDTASAAGQWEVVDGVSGMCVVSSTSTAAPSGVGNQQMSAVSTAAMLTGWKGLEEHATAELSPNSWYAMYRAIKGHVKGHPLLFEGWRSKPTGPT